MGAIFFLVMFGCLGLVIYWFIQNESRDGDGAIGVLGVRPNEGASDEDAYQEQGARYRVRKAPDAVQKDIGEKEHIRQVAADGASSAQSVRGVFRKKTGGGFVSKGSGLRHKEKARIKPAPPDKK